MWTASQEFDIFWLGLMIKMNFEAIAEKKIQDAMEAGLFDRLPGQGKPLRLDENPHEPVAWRLAHSLLKDNGFTLPWIVERQEIEEAVEAVLKQLANAYRETHGRVAGQQPDIWAQADWRRATNTFTEAALKLNKRIRDYNLTTPSPLFQRSLIEIEKEIARVASEAATAAMWAAAK